MFPDLLTWYKSVKTLLRVIRPGRFPNPRREYAGLIDVDWVGGSILLVSREHFDHLGGWCEDYWMYVEDCDLCYVACGRLDGFWERGLSAWDLAAGAVIVEEAGGIITDYCGEAGYLDSGDVVAAAPGVHGELLGVLRKFHRE